MRCNVLSVATLCKGREGFQHAYISTDKICLTCLVRTPIDVHLFLRVRGLRGETAPQVLIKENPGGLHVNRVYAVRYCKRTCRSEIQTETFLRTSKSTTNHGSTLRLNGSITSDPPDLANTFSREVLFLSLTHDSTCPPPVPGRPAEEHEETEREGESRSKTVSQTRNTRPWKRSVCTILPVLVTDKRQNSSTVCFAY